MLVGGERVSTGLAVSEVVAVVGDRLPGAEETIRVQGRVEVVEGADPDRL